MKKTISKLKKEAKKETMKYGAKVEELEDRTKKLEGEVNSIWNELKTGKGMIVECVSCGYRWRTESILKTVSCPSCGNKVKIKRELNPSEEGDASIKDLANIGKNIENNIDKMYVKGHSIYDLDLDN